eukprot:2147765-Amphidinium_carterae.1
MDPWTAANAWMYPSPMMSQSQWGMTNGWFGSGPWSAMDPSAAMHLDQEINGLRGHGQVKIQP